MDFWERQALREERRARGERIKYSMRKIDIAADRSVAVGFNEEEGYILVFTARETVTKVALSPEAFEALRSLTESPPGAEKSSWVVVSNPSEGLPTPAARDEVSRP